MDITMRIRFRQKERFPLFQSDVANGSTLPIKNQREQRRRKENWEPYLRNYGILWLLNLTKDELTL